MNTPWGESQHERQLGGGIVQVDTAGHGGIVVPPAVAFNMTAVARRFGLERCGTYYYEEDCDWAIPLWEFPAIWDVYFDYSERFKTREERERFIFNTLKFWNIEYLVQRNLIRPDMAGDSFRCSHCKDIASLRYRNSWMYCSQCQHRVCQC